ncbi:hypothetical protein ACFYO1_01810 [Nocardia sp. NPDC006044]|uniref:hypothetical protein n=1 Tax=Nocardia sp. NPDC006044 TaxID=3364306 RepID=UPI003698B4A4
MTAPSGDNDITPYAREHTEMPVGRRRPEDQIDSPERQVILAVGRKKIRADDTLQTWAEEAAVIETLTSNSSRRCCGFGR